MNLNLRITHIWNEYQIFVFTPAISFERSDGLTGLSIKWLHFSVDLFVTSKNEDE
jgi:hypothetical protein